MIVRMLHGSLYKLATVMPVWHLHILGLRIARIRSRTQRVVSFKTLFSHSYLNSPLHNLLILLDFDKGKEAVSRKTAY